MSIQSPESTQQSKLRLDAETRLKEGSAPPTRGWPPGVTALDLIHKLASAPESAHDALKMLHELQVHQVELDLQHEQMEVTQRELAEDLARYRALFEAAPLAYFSLGPEGAILEGNAAAAGLFGVAQDELRGRRVDALLAPESRSAMLAFLQRLRTGDSMNACEVRASSTNGSRPLQLVASVAPDDESILAILVDTTRLKPPDPRV